MNNTTLTSSKIGGSMRMHELQVTVARLYRAGKHKNNKKLAVEGFEPNIFMRINLSMDGQE